MAEEVKLSWANTDRILKTPVLDFEQAIERRSNASFEGRFQINLIEHGAKRNFVREVRSCEVRSIDCVTSVGSSVHRALFSAEDVKGVVANTEDWSCGREKYRQEQASRANEESSMLAGIH